MKSIDTHRPKHRQTSAAGPRHGAAALMIGGLMAGTVATAGTASLNRAPSTPDAAQTSVAPPVATPDLTQSPAAKADPDLADFSSESLAELRSDASADRSQARSSPDSDAASVNTLLAGSPFTGTTSQVEPPVTAEPTPEPVEPIEQPAEPVEQVEVAASAEEPHVHEEPPPAAPATPAAPVAPSATESTSQTELVQQAPEQAAPAPVGGSLLGIAASYVGYPYVLYGTPPQAFDCSAYTWWVFKQAGIDIPRTVAGQKAAVTPVSNPQPGDLVFYNDFYHVGIYAGNGMTYEALNPSTDVRYGPLITSNVWYGRIG
ncbi:NlpC/P60 family protein [Ornithinimicrobium sp. Y1694]|uniref:C40 family peptidase n=1 Tax=Ornithinimicrobium sp. Y1694 TaxID=3418590 RepID=UPI003CEC857F